MSLHVILNKKRVLKESRGGHHDLFITAHCILHTIPFHASINSPCPYLTSELCSGILSEIASQDLLQGIASTWKLAAVCPDLQSARDGIA